MKLLCIVLLTAITQRVIAQEMLSNQPIKQSAGIYFENLGKLELYRSNWKLINYVNLEPLGEKEKILELYVKEIGLLCGNRTAAPCQRDGELTLLKQKIDRLKADRGTINDLIGHFDSASTRPRRGIFDFVGKASKVLFGTLDSDDADKFNEQINAAADDAHQLAELHRKQISVVKSTIGQFTKAFEESSKKFKEVDFNLVQLESQLRKRNGRIDSNQRSVTVNSHLIKCNDMVTEYELELEVLTSAILLARKGVLHPKILTPRQLFDSLNDYNVSITSDKRIPVPLETNYFGTLMDISEISIIYGKNRLVYVIEIPLADVQSYTLYSVTPTPVRQDGESIYTFIHPTHTHLGLSSDEKKFALLSENDVSHCKTFGKEFLCRQFQPLYQVAGLHSCEAELLRSAKTEIILKECDVRLTRIYNTLWLQLKTPNTWMYVAPRNETLHVVCRDALPRSTDLVSTGILKLSKDCNAVSGNVLLQSQAAETISAINTDFVPKFALDVSDVYKDIENLHSINFSELSLLNVGNVPQLDAQLLKSASSSLTELYNQANDIGRYHRTETAYQQAVSWATYVGIAFIVLLVIYACLKCFLPSAPILMATKN